MTADPEDLIEHVARSIVVAEGGDPDEPVHKDFSTGQTILAWHRLLPEARRHVVAFNAMWEFAKQQEQAAEKPTGQWDGIPTGVDS